MRRSTPGLIAMLHRRGLEPLRLTEPRDLLLPKLSRRQAAFYERLKNYSFRLVLRDIIKHQRSFNPSDLTRFCSLSKVEKHLAFLSNLGLVRAVGKNLRLVSKPIRSFGDTLEWFVARVFEREFQAEVLWGIRFKNSAAGGDYDVVAAMEGELVYVEAKSSPPKHIEQKEVASFLDRINDLLPHIAFFYVDTELRMKDKIVVLFEEELRSRYGKAAAKHYPVMRIKNELFGINHQVFLVNSKRDVIANFRDCFRDHWRSRLRI
jgi:hypothetical protein